MRVEWNKVTPLSKFIALVLFVALPFLGFFLGIEYGELVSYQNNLNGVSAAMGGSSTSDYYSNPSLWQTSRIDQAGFSIAYPIDFDAEEGYAATPANDWRMNAATPGVKSFTLIIPRAFEPQTNFIDAKLTVGESRNNLAIKDCLAPDQSGGPATATSTSKISGVPFTVFENSGAGAGNFYETTSYRALHAGQCYAIEYTIHSSEIANYPASYGLKPFDKAKLTDLLNRVADTFKLL